MLKYNLMPGNILQGLTVSLSHSSVTLLFKFKLCLKMMEDKGLIVSLVDKSRWEEKDVYTVYTSGWIMTLNHVISLSLSFFKRLSI